ncbi:LysE family translocator, partial [Acinetobacter baumannii]
MWQLYGHEFLTLALIHFMAVILPGPDFVITV